MAKMNVVGDAVVITSTLKLEEIELVKKFRPEALTLKGGEDGKEPIFKIDVGERPDINKYGAVFTGKTRDEDGFATLTLGLKCSGDDLKEELADKFGGALINVGALEDLLPHVIEEIGVERANVLDHIEIQ